MRVIHTTHLITLGILVSLTAACGRDSTPTGPTPSVAVTSRPEPTPNGANWRGDATVISASNSGGCGWGRSPGETRSVFWRVLIDGMAVSLDQDMTNFPTDDIPYSGTLSGRDFTATYTQPGTGSCQFKGGILIGSFSEDFSAFDADETLVWGEGAGETRVHRRWRATKL